MSHKPKTTQNKSPLKYGNPQFKLTAEHGKKGGSSLGYKLAGYKELLAIDFEKNAE